MQRFLGKHILKVLLGAEKYVIHLTFDQRWRHFRLMRHRNNMQKFQETCARRKAKAEHFPYGAAERSNPIISPTKTTSLQSSHVYLIHHIKSCHILFIISK